MDRQNKNIVSTQRKAPQSDQRREGLLIQELLKNNRIRRKLRRVVAMLSAIVMFVTFNSLTRPADTMEVEQAVAEPLNTVEASLPEEAAKTVDVDEAPEEQEQSLPAPEEEPQPEQAGAADVSETTSESDADPEQEAADEAKAETKREVNAETDDATVVLSGADFAADSTVTFDWVTSGSRTSEIKKAIAEEIGGAEVEVRPFDLILTPDLVEEMHTTIRFDKAVTLSGLNASNYNKANLNIFFYYSDAAYQVNPSDVGAKFDDQGRLEKLWFKTVGVGTFAIVYQVPAEPTEAPAVEETEAPAVEETEAPAVEETEAPAVEETEEPAVEETEEPAAEETEEPAVEETEQPAVEETEEPTVEETEEPAVEETEEPAVEETEEPAVEETEEPAVEETEEPAVEETEEPAVEETEEPAVEETEEPAVEETEEPAVEETEEPAVEETEEPAVEETEEPAVEETEEPAVEETEEPAVEETEEPAATETPAPTATPAPETIGTINVDFGSEKGSATAVKLSSIFAENGVQANIENVNISCDDSALSVEKIADDVVFTALNYFDRIVVVFRSTEVKGEIAFTNPEPQELPEAPETPAEAPEIEEAVDPVSTVNDARLQGVDGNTVLPENAEVVITAVQDRETVLSHLEKLLSLPRMIRRGGDAEAAQDEEAEASQTAETGSVTGYALFDINVYADDAPVEETGRVQVSFDVNIDMDKDAGVPENAKVTKRDIQIYHLHNNMLVYNDEYEVEEENGIISRITIITDTFSDFIVKYTVDFEYTDPVTGETFGWSWYSPSSHRIADIMSQLGVEGDIEDVSLSLVVGAGTEGALYLEQKEDGWYLTSDVAFEDIYELKVTVDGVVYTLYVSDAVTAGYTDMTQIMDIDVDMQEGQSINGPTTTDTLHGDLKFEVKDSAAFNVMLHNALEGDKKVKLDYDLTDLMNAHETLTRLSGSGDLVGGTGTLGTYTVVDGHLLIDLDATKITDVNSAKGDLTLNITVDRTKTDDSGTETFTFPGGGGSFEINWPEKEHGAGSKSVDHVSDTIYPGQDESEYLEYNYTLTLDGGADLDQLNLSDYLPEGMSLVGNVNVSCVTTTQPQTSTLGASGLWSDWSNSGTATISEHTGTINSSSVSGNKLTANVWGALSMSENPDGKTTPVVQPDGNTRTRSVTTSKYTLTYTARITRGDALRLIGEGNKLDLKNTAIWNEGGTPIPGGDATVIINKGTLNPGSKSIEPNNSGNIQAKTEDIITVGGVECVVVSYAISITEPIDASTAVLTDKLSQYQSLYTGAGSPELYVNDQKVKDVTLTASGAQNGQGGTITYNLHTDLVPDGFKANTKYTLRYKTLVKKSDFGKEITNETDWTIGTTPVDGEDKTTVVTKMPPKQGEKWSNRKETHVTGNGPWEIPWEIKTYQEQTFNNVVLSDNFSDDQTLVANSFVFKIGTNEYKLSEHPEIAGYIHISGNSFTIDFDEVLKALTGDNTDPAFKAQTDYRVLYTTTTEQYDDPATSDKEKSVNHSQWTFDGESDNPTEPEVVLEKDEYKAGDKKVKSEEGTADGKWKTDGEAEVESVTISEDDNDIDLSYKITLKEPMDGVTQAVLQDTFSSLEQLDASSMVIHHKGQDYAVPAELLTVSGNTFTVDFVAVMRYYKGDDYTLVKGEDYELRYNTSIPLTEEVKNLLKTKENVGGEEVIKGLTVENHQTWHFDGPNGPEDKPGEPVEYTFKEKPYNGGTKGVRVWNEDSQEWMDIISGKTTDDQNNPVYGDFEKNGNAGITVTAVDSENNKLHYTIRLTEHRNANKVVLKDQYYRNQTLDTNSFTVKFRHGGKLHTINVPAGSITTGDHSFEMNLTDVLEAEGYEFTPEVEYIIEYDTTVTETGNGQGGNGHSEDPGEGDGFDNVATWDFDDGNEEPGGNTEVHLDIPDYIPGEKTVTVREEVASKTQQTSDWNYWYTNGNPEHIEHDSKDFVVSKVVDAPEDLEDDGYHLDYLVSIYEERPIDTAVLTDTFKGSAQQTLQTGSFKLQIDREGDWIDIPASFINAPDPTAGYTLNLTDFLTSIGKKFEKYTHYDISFTTVTPVNGNTVGSGDGQDNRADWLLNDEPSMEGGHTEVHIEKVPHLDKTYYNKDGEEKGEVDFGEQVKYVITYGDAGQQLNGKELRDSMTNYHHIDRSKPITVYTNYNKTTGTGTVLAENLISSVPSGWQVNVQDQGGNWNQNMWNDVLYIKFPDSPQILGPVTIVYTAIVGSKEQTGILGTKKVYNKVRSEDIEIPTEFDLKAGTVELQKTALPIEDDTLEANNRKVWWTVDVTPVEMSLKGLVLRDTARFSTESAKNAREGIDTQGMSVNTNTYELVWKNDSVDPSPGEEGGHRAGDRLPTNLYRIDNNDIYFLDDITEPIQVKFATHGGNYTHGSIFLYNKVRITDTSYNDVGEPSDAEKGFEEEGEVTASKTFDEEKTVVDKDGNADIYWTITINTTGSATVYGYTVSENKYTYSTTSADDARTNYSWLTFNTNTYDGVVITDKDGNKLTKNVDYKLDNGLKFLKRLQGPITISVPMTKTGFPSGTVWLNNQATLTSPDNGSTPIEGDGVIENYTLPVDKTVTTDKASLPKAPEFDQIVTYKVTANGMQDSLPDGDLLFVDVLPAGMEYYDDQSLHIGFHNNGTQYDKNQNSEVWEDLQPTVTESILEDGRVQQTITIDFAAAAAKHPGVSFTLNGNNMVVTYKARLSESERNRLKTLGSGAPQVYENDVVITQGEKVRGEDDTEWDYTWDNGLKKEDITDAHYGENQHGANIYYKININPEGRTMNHGEPMVLSDRIDTSMELMPDSVQVFRVNDDDTRTDVTNDDNIRVSYDGITRLLSVRVPDEQYYVLEFFAAIDNAYKDLTETFENTAVLKGESTWRDHIEEEHTVQTMTGSFSYTVPGGFIIKKFDANKIKTNLEGAEFTLYKAYFPALEDLDAVYRDYANYDNDKNTVNYDLSPFVISGQGLDPKVTYSNAQGMATYKDLKVNELYYWMETRPPEGGYSAGEFAKPQYVIIYTNNQESDAHSEEHAVLLDHLISDANGIIVNNVVEGYVWYATNNQFVDYKAEKIWQDNDDADGLRPDYIWVQLKQNGENYDNDATPEVNEGLVKVTPDNFGDWNYTWYDLPASDEEGEDYVYTAEELTPQQMLDAELITEEEKTALEEQLADYATFYRTTTGGIQIINRKRDETTMLVKKAWDDDNNVSKLRPGFIEVKLYREVIGGPDLGTVTQMTLDENNVAIEGTTPIRIYANDNWQIDISGLVTESGENAYRYFLVESPVDGYDPTYQDPYTAHLTGGAAGGTAAGVVDSDGIVTITNKLNTVRATKRWLNKQGTEVWVKNVTFKLMRQTVDGEFVDVTKPRYFQENGLEWSQTIETTEDNRTAIWDHLDELEEGESYFAIEYQIQDVADEDIERNEQGAAMSFTLNGEFYDVTGGVSTSGTGTIINSPRVDKEFTKHWVNTTFDDSEEPNNRKNLKLQVQLIRINRATGQIDQAFNSDARNYPEGQPITITFDKSGGSITAGKNTITLPENADEDETWTFEWKDLPITEWSETNGESVEFIYRVQEVKVLDAAGGDITSSFTQTVDEENDWEYTNTYEGQKLKISKQWNPEPEEDWTITAKLQVEKRLVEQDGAAVTPAEWTGNYVDYEENGAVKVVTIGKKNGQPMEGVTYDAQTGKYTVVTALPRYEVDEANHCVYELKFTAVEGDITGGYVPTVQVDPVTGDVTIVNDKPMTDIEVEKVWDGDITSGAATMVLYQVTGTKADDLEPGEVDPAKPTDQIRVTVNANLSNATNKDATITVSYTGTDDEGAAVSGSFVLSNAEGWSKSVDLPRGGTYSFSYARDGENITAVTPESTADVTTTQTIGLAATAVQLREYTYTFTVPEAKRPTKGSFSVTCNGVTRTLDGTADEFETAPWTVSFPVVEEDEVTYSGTGDGKFITGVAFNPETATPVSGNQTIEMTPAIEPLTMNVPVSITWDETLKTLPEDATATVTIAGNGEVHTVSLPKSGSWQDEITLDRLDDNGDLIEYAVSATASTATNKKLILVTVPPTIDSTGTVAIEGRVEGPDPVVVTVNRINNGTIVQHIGPKNFDPGTTIIIKVKRDGNTSLTVTYETSDGKSGSIPGTDGVWSMVEKELELTLPNTAGAYTVDITHGWGANAAELISVEAKAADGANAVQNPASAPKMMSAPRKAVANAPALRSAPTPSTRKTFYDGAVAGATGDLAFSVVKFKDLPDGAVPVSELPSGAMGAAVTGSTATVTGGTAVITNGGSVKWEGLPMLDENGNPIYYYIVEKDATAKADTMDVSYAYEYNEDGTIKKVTITNTTTGTPEPETADLEITKKVGEYTDTVNTFTFEIMLTNNEAEVDGTYPAVKTLADGETVDETVTSVTFSGGKATVTLKANEKIRISELPGGTEYTVDEKSLPAGYTEGTHSGDQGTLVSGTEAKAIMNNVYAAEGTADIQVGKVLTGRDLAKDEFSFTLSAETAGAPLNKKDGTTYTAYTETELTVKNAAPDNSGVGAVSFLPLYYTLDDAGKTYIYKIVEDDFDVENVTRNTTDGPEIIYAKVVVGTDKGDGTLNPATVTYWKDEACTETLTTPNFINDFNNVVTAIIEGTKAMADDTEPASTYKFDIEAKDPTDAPTPTQTQVTNDKASFKFDAITYPMSLFKDIEADGETGVKTRTFTYTVTENHDDITADANGNFIDANGVMYDKQAIDVTVTVTYNTHTGEMEATVSPEKADLKFTNTAPGGLKIEKHVTYNGLTPSGSEQKSKLAGTYTFTIFTDDACKKPYLENGQPKTVSIIIDTTGASKSSDPITLPAGDYWIKENDTGNGTVAVLNPVPVTVESGKTGDAAVIATVTNNYADGPDELFIKVEKEFIGIDPKYIPNNFQITLTGSKGTSMTLNRSNATINGQTWSWKITGIKENETFTIAENNQNLTGYKVTSTGIGESQTVKAADITFQVIGSIETTCSKTVWPVAEGTLFAGSLTSAGGNHDAHVIIISKESLSAAERKAVEEKLLPILQRADSDVWKLPIVYYSVEEHPNGFQLDSKKTDSVVTYAEGNVTFSATDIWQHVASVSYTRNDPTSADFEVTNAYTTSINAEKKWYAEASQTPEDTPKGVSVTLTLKRYIVSSSSNAEDEGFTPKTVTISADANGNVTRIADDATETINVSDDNFANAWKYTWDDLPKFGKDSSGNIIEYTYMVTESEFGDEYYRAEGESSGYLPTLKEDGTIDKNTQEFNNHKRASYTLPETGGMGTKAYTYGGIALMVLAVLGYVLLETRKRGRGEGI